jgi:hypothetical protein
MIRSHRIFLAFVLIAIALLVALNALFGRYDIREDLIYPEGSGIAFGVTFDTTVFIRFEQQLAAVQFYAMTSRIGILDAAKYRYWYFKNGAATGVDISGPPHGHGVVYEGGPSYSEFVKTGPLWMEWSHSNWVYPNSGGRPQGRIEVTATETTQRTWTAEQIAALRWFSLHGELSPVP